MKTAQTFVASTLLVAAACITGLTALTVFTALAATSARAESREVKEGKDSKESKETKEAREASSCEKNEPGSARKPFCDDRPAKRRLPILAAPVVLPTIAPIAPIAPTASPSPPAPRPPVTPSPTPIAAVPASSPLPVAIPPPATLVTSAPAEPAAIITNPTAKWGNEANRKGVLPVAPSAAQNLKPVGTAEAAKLPSSPSSTPSSKPLPPHPPTPPHPPPPAPYESGQLVIYWKDSGDAAIGLAVMAREFKLNPASENRLPNLGGVIATFKLASQREAERVKNLLTARYPSWNIDFHGRYVPHQSTPTPLAKIATLPSSNMPRPRLFTASKIDYPLPAPDAGSGIRVGVIDTAVESGAMLKSVSVVRRSFLAAGEISASPTHGTAIAALIAGRDSAAEFSGISPGVSLHVAAIMRIQGGETASNTAALVRALDWLVGERVQIINLSLGGAGDQVMEEAISRVVRARIIIIAAAGNQGEDAVPSYPAAYPGVIAVTASDALDHIFEQANRGSYVALTAPGVDVWVPDKSGGRYVSGTSFAAAVVSGAVAVMLARYPALDASSARELLCQHARDLGSPGIDPVFGCGLIQLSSTIAALPVRGALK